MLKIKGKKINRMLIASKEEEEAEKEKNQKGVGREIIECKSEERKMEKQKRKEEVVNKEAEKRKDNERNPQ